MTRLNSAVLLAIIGGLAIAIAVILRPVFLSSPSASRGNDIIKNVRELDASSPSSTLRNVSARTESENDLTNQSVRDSGLVGRVVDSVQAPVIDADIFVVDELALPVGRGLLDAMPSI